MSTVAHLLPVLPQALLGSAPGSVDRLSAADHGIRSSVTTSRRIGFAQVGSGSGCSTTASAIASAFASRRSGRVLGVDAGSGGLGWHLAIPDGERISRPAPAGFAPGTSWDATDGLARTATGLYYLGGSSSTSSTEKSSTLSVSEWSNLVAPIGRFFDIVVTDWGTRSWRRDLLPVADASHVLCLIARADRLSIEDTASVIPGLLERSDARVVLAIVDAVGVGTGAGPDLRPLGVPVLRIPFDPARAAWQPVGSRRLRPRTRIAQAELAGCLLASATNARPETAS